MLTNPVCELGPMANKLIFEILQLFYERITRVNNVTIEDEEDNVK